MSAGLVHAYAVNWRVVWVMVVAVLPGTDQCLA